MTVAEVGVRLNIGRTLVRELVGKPHGIPAIRVGRNLRVHPADVDRWLAAHVEGGASVAFADTAQEGRGGAQPSQRGT